MADPDRIKRNVRKMIDQGAPEADIDAYVSSEGLTPEQLRQPAPFTAGGTAKAYGSGILNTLAGLAEMPQAASEAAAKLGMTGARWARDKMGIPFSPEENAAAQEITDTRLPRPLSAAREAAGLTHDPQNTAEEYARTAGEFTPNMLAGPGGLFRRFVTQTAVPALTSETAGQAARRTGNGEYEPLARFAGGVAGSVLPAAGTRIATPLRVDPGRASMVDLMRQEGVDLTAGQRTGSRSLKWAESALGGGKAQGIVENQKGQFTRAAMRRIGENTDRAGPEELARAGQRIGQTFDDLASKTVVPFDQHLGGSMSHILSNYETTASAVSKAPRQIINRIAELATNNGGRLEGSAYQNITTDIRERMAVADGATKTALGQIQTALQDAFGRHASTPLRQAWQDARGQYKNLIAIEKAMGGAGEETALGMISPSQLRNAVKTQNSRAYVRGRGDLGPLARAGEATIKPLPTSGTSERGAAKAIPAMLGAALAAKLSGGDVAATIGGGAAAAAGASAVPWLAGRALMSKPVQNYLANQGPTMRELLSQDAPRAARAALIEALLRAERDRQQAPPGPR